MSDDSNTSAPGGRARPAVFLDRDGTMIHDVNYLSRLDDIRWFPYTVDAIRLLNRAGFLVFVISNQGGVGLGLFDEAFVGTVHRAMAARIEAAGAKIDGWFHCPHHPRSILPGFRVNCDCRKPKPGMVHQAQRQFAIDLGRSFVVGDKASDVGLARNVGARGVLVHAGYGESALADDADGADSPAFVAADLMAAVSWMLLASGHPCADGR
jgi:D-glycero-D-manno-heptose 1,7-bisphosphate phosphatase